MKLVSVIVPVYKVERYLRKCLDSVCNQTYQNIEIILVDDGSPDSCGEICESYKETDSRIKVIHKENAGLGMARNSGIKIACGDYVMFVDSDDWIDEDMIEKLVTSIEMSNADMAICSFKKCISDNKIIEIKKEDKVRSYDDSESIFKNVLCPILGNGASRGKTDEREMCVWTNLYKMSLINKDNISFVSEREYLTEDFFFNVPYILACKKIVRIPDCLYNYRYNEQSLSNAYRENKIDLLYIMTVCAIKFFEERNLTEHIGWRLQRAFVKRLRHCLMIVMEAKIPFSEKRKKFKTSMNYPLSRSFARNYPYQDASVQERMFVRLLSGNSVSLFQLYIKIQCWMIELRGFRN